MSKYKGKVLLIANFGTACVEEVQAKGCTDLYT